MTRTDGPELKNARQRTGRAILQYFAIAVLVATQTTHGGDTWPNWRGPSGNSVIQDPGTGYPTTWGEEANVIWKVATPGWGTSTPVVFHDSVVITAAEDEGKNQIVSYNLEGEEQWKVEFGDTIQARNRKAGGANPSPVSDGDIIIGYFKNGDLGCVDFNGKKLWSHNLQNMFGPDRLNWDLGTSPVLTSNAVVVAVMHQGPSFLVAFEKRSGKQLWKTERDTGAPAEARDSYSTPMVITVEGEERLIVLGGDQVTSHNAKTGAEIWHVGNLNPRGARNFRSIASPAILNDRVYAPYARGDTLTAMSLGGTGDVTASHVNWTVEDAGADVPTPIAVNGKVYVCRDRGVVLCLDAESGEEIWSETLPKNRQNYSSSPVIANGHLYVTREDGTTYVIKLGDQPTVVSENRLREYTYATPAFAHGRIYLRTSDWLFCIGTDK